MAQQHIYIQTIGCQMNIYDSERIASLLAREGYQTCTAPDTADVVVVNTCAIRAKAEQKLYSLLGRLARLKQERSTLLIAVGGCVAQQEGRELLARAPWVDVVFGTHAIHRLPEMLHQARTRHQRLVNVDFLPYIQELEQPLAEPVSAEAGTLPVCRFVTIMQGCDNFCSYCVVPFVRGTEQSRPPKQIEAEVRRLVAAGVREVTLLGQNVNSYGQKTGGEDFTDLLIRLHDIDGLRRLRFTTSHPKDLSGRLIQAFRTLPRLCHHIHLPVQSGSTTILQAMNRKYSPPDYLRLVARLREACPEIAITTDFIVGFPDESRKDFEDSLQLLQQVQFDSIFAFKYSDRPQTPAAGRTPKVAEAEKARRLHLLLAEQTRITAAKNTALLGTRQEILVEGFSRKTDAPASGPAVNGSQAATEARIEYTGRTSTHKIVNFAPPPASRSDIRIQPGDLVTLTIARVRANSLWGEVEIPKLKAENSALL